MAAPVDDTEPRLIPPAAWTSRLAGLSIAVAGFIAYMGSFGGPLLYDDRGSVLENPTIRSLASAWHPPAGGWPVSGRPILNVSFALNYALSGVRTASYHGVNLLIHLAAALVLFGVVRRTIEARGGASRRVAAKEMDSLRSVGIAWAVALLWTLHPLLTESVTYISQRAESLMGLWYLLTLYCFIRATEAEGNGTSPRRLPAWAWSAAAVIACAVGMATKEVMATAPIVLFFYDRVFAAGSWSEAWRRRRGTYAALALTWIPLAVLVAGTGGRGGTAGFGLNVTGWAYAVTQFRAIAHYLRLAVWPHPLIFTYGLVLGGPRLELGFDAALVLGLIGWSIAAAWKGSRAGFLGIWFFGILAPSSSVIPVATELIAEHRVYLSLAAVLVGAVWAGDRGLRWLGTALGWKPGFVAALGFGIAGAVAVAEGAATADRNRAYGSVLALWSDTVEKSPEDPGARNNLGNALAEVGRLNEAVAQYREAMRLVPGYGDPHENLGNALFKLGRPAEAIPEFEAALRAHPDNASVRYALGASYARLGRPDEAVREFERALGGKAESSQVWYNLGNALLDRERFDGAEKAFAAAVRLRPDYGDAVVNHAGVLARLGQSDRAIEEFRSALRLEPQAADVHNNLGGLLAERGRYSEARGEFAEALRLKPDFREARNNLRRVEALLGSNSGR